MLISKRCGYRRGPRPVSSQITFPGAQATVERHDEIPPTALHREIERTVDSVAHEHRHLRGAIAVDYGCSKP
jgi:hypothetical protein